MKKFDPIQVEITNGTRLAREGHETEELHAGDVLTLPHADAHELIAAGKAVKAEKGSKDGRHGLRRFEAAEAAREKAAQAAPAGGQAKA